MTPMGGAPLVILLIVAVVIVLIVLGAAQAQKRRKELLAWAQAEGWSFSAAHDRSFDDRFADFECLRQGSGRYACNIIEGRCNDRDLVAFDYHYETHSTNSKGHTQTHHHHFSAIILRAGIPLKPLVIRPEGLFDKVAGFFGFDDIDFESAEFSRRFFVKSPDRKWAYDVIHPRTMEFLLQGPRYNMQFDHTYAIAWHNSRFSAAEFQQAVVMTEGVLDQLPGYLVQQQKQSGAYQE